MDEEDIQLKHFIRSGFDYGAYCKKIDQDTKLTPEEQAFAKYILDPDSTLIDVGQRIYRYTREQPSPFEVLDAAKANTYTGLDSSSYPAIHNAVYDAWGETKQHYHKEITAYNERFKPLENEYPNGKPELLLLHTDLIQAGATFSDTGVPQIAISRGFLEKLPADEQKAIIFHECYHLMEPVLAQMKPEDYAKKAAAENKLTQNAVMRSKEFEADILAATLSNADSLLSALVKVEELSTGFKKSFDLQSRYEDILMSSIYHAAHASGFGIDEEKRKQFSKNIVFWIDALNDEVGIGARTPVKQNTAVEEAPTHPPMEERIENIRSWQQKGTGRTDRKLWTKEILRSEDKNHAIHVREDKGRYIVSSPDSARADEMEAYLNSFKTGENGFAIGISRRDNSITVKSPNPDLRRFLLEAERANSVAQKIPRR